MVTKLVDYCKSFPVRCRSAGVYADSETGIRLKYDKESNSFLQDKKNGKVTRVNKKLLRPLFTYAVNFTSKVVSANVFRANSISKHGLNWSLIYSSEFSLVSMCYTEQGEGSAKYWFNQEKNYDVAEKITCFSESNSLYFKDYLNSFLEAIPFGEKVRDVLPSLDIFLLLDFLYSGAYKKLVEKAKDMRRRFKFGLEVEFTGIARGSAANVLAKVLGSEKRYVGGVYCKHIVNDISGRCWTIMRDSSITPIPEKRSKPKDIYKVELVTPILYDKDIPTIHKIITALRERGMKVNSSCGLHIHIDCSEWNDNSLINIVNIMANKEELLFRALNVPEVRRNRWCKGVNINFIKAVNSKKVFSITELKNEWYAGTSHDTLAHYHESRYHALNLHSYWQGKGIEFRLFNSTTDADEILAYLNLVRAICNYAVLQRRRAAYCSRSKADDKTKLRAWLQQLGLTGEEYAETRRQMIKRLNR